MLFILPLFASLIQGAMSQHTFDTICYEGTAGECDGLAATWPADLHLGSNDPSPGLFLAADSATLDSQLSRAVHCIVLAVFFSSPAAVDLGKLSGNKAVVLVGGGLRIPLTASSASAVDSLWVVDCILDVIAPVTVGSLYLEDSTVENGSNLRPGYALLSGTTSTSVQDSVAWNDVAVILSETVPTVEFHRWGWQIGSMALSITGKLSLVVTAELQVLLKAVPAAGESHLAVHGINISVRQALTTGIERLITGRTTRGHPRLTVRFDADWDNIVANNPELTIHAAAVADVSIINSPMKGTVKLEAVPDEPSPEPTEDNRISDWIADVYERYNGIIIGVGVAVVVIAIIAIVIVAWMSTDECSRKIANKQREQNSASST